MTSASALSAFVVLLPRGTDPEVARVLAVRGHVAFPSMRGREFFAASGTAAERLDRWWAAEVAGRAPVYVVSDEPDLEGWVPGSAGYWIIGVGDAARGAELRQVSEQVYPLVTSDPVELARYATRLVELVAESSGVPVAGIEARVREPAGTGYMVETPPAAPALPITYGSDAETTSSRQDVALREPPTGATAAPGRPPLDVTSVARRLLSWRPARVSSGDLAALGRAVNAARPIVVGFASRKGGVGKTTYAAAVAATIGDALDGLPDTAALVDGNVTNPDSWALNLPPDATTVRLLVSCLASGIDPPAEQYARTPRLAIYPESRDSEEPYARAEIDIVAEYVRRRHAFVAVDLPNALPSLTTGGPGAVAAAWLSHCDVVVLPFGADPRSRQGLLEYLDAIEDEPVLSQVPVIAPYISPVNPRIRSDPGVQADLGVLRRRGVRVVGVPEDDRVLLALLRDQPINHASPRLRSAYVDLARAVVDARVGSPTA